jgi:hypothetical protein
MCDLRLTTETSADEKHLSHLKTKYIFVLPQLFTAAGHLFADGQEGKKDSRYRRRELGYSEC